MTEIELTEAKTHLSYLIDRVQSGEIIHITRHGKVVAQLVMAKPERKPIRLADLRALTDDQSRQTESAGDFVRKMRDDSRY